MLNRLIRSTHCGAFALSMLAARLAMSQGIPPQRVRLEARTHSVTIQGSLDGPDNATRDFVVSARAGQVMGVDLTARRSSVYFNVLPPGNGPALTNTSISGEPRWTGTLPADGDYIVRVYLMRGAARRNASARFVVAIAMTPVRASASQVPALTSQVPASTSPVPASTSKGLAGTSWQLVKLQSMDDRTITPGGGVYTINFGVDGKAQVRADCNRGQATWRASGAQLEFGPLAMTRAECPRGSLAPRFATDLGFVRSFSIRNGKLYLSLVADAGVYEFAR